MFEFHHWDASEKDFGLSESGILHRWEKVVAELAKCVMLCANCHREVHAGVRELDKGLLGLAESAGSYGASPSEAAITSATARAVFPLVSTMRSLAGSAATSASLAS